MTQALTTQQLTSDEQHAGGVIFSIRWGDVQFVQPRAIAALFSNCNPGEFAVSGLKILGGSGLSVLEDYPIAVPGNSMLWLTIVKSTDTTGTLPASNGVVCAGDSSSYSGTTLSQGTKNSIYNAINIILQSGNVQNIGQLIQITQNIIQQCFIVGNVINNSTVSCDQTAVQNATANAIRNVTSPSPQPGNITAPTPGTNETRTTLENQSALLTTPEESTEGGGGGGTNDTSNERQPCPIGWRFVNGECINPNAPAEGAIGPNDNTGGGTTEGSTGGTTEGTESGEGGEQSDNDGNENTDESNTNPPA